MRIACFYSDNLWAGWVQNRGFPEIVRRMGHEIVDIPIPPTKQVTRAQVEKINKPIDDCDIALISGPEHLKLWITQFYPDLKIPKVGWFHESFVRDDYQLNINDFKWLDHFFFPDPDDAEKYKGEWLPLGVDTEMFSPPWDDRIGCWCATSQENRIGGVVYHRPVIHYEECKGTPIRTIDVAFIGLMYEKRQEYLKKLLPLLKGIDIRIGNVIVQDLDGINIRKSMELLAETYRRIKVFLCLPTLSTVLVAKVLEAMACGCYLVAPKQNEKYLDGHFTPYDSLQQCVDGIKDALKNPNREEEARLGCEDVHKNHRMELRIEKLLASVGVAV